MLKLNSNSLRRHVHICCVTAALTIPSALMAEVTFTPGTWETHSNVNSPFLDLLGMNDDPAIERECLDVKSSSEILAHLQILPGEDCSLENEKSTASSYEASFTCQPQHGMSSRGVIKYRFAEDVIDFEIKGTITAQGQAFPHNQKSQSKHIGDC